MSSSQPRLQYTLRAALTVSMLCAVALGVYIVDDHRINAALTLMVLAGPLGAIVGIIIAGRRGAISGTVAGIIGGGLAGIIAESYNWSFQGEDNLLAFGLLTSLLISPLLYWTLKRMPHTPAEQAGARTAARRSLLALALAIPLSLLRNHIRQLGHSESSDPVWAVDVMEAVVMGLVVLPWIVMARHRAAGAAGRPYSRWNIVAKVLLLIAAILGPVSEGLAALVLITPPHGPYGGLAAHMLAGLVLEVGLGMAGVCFVMGFVIQVWRDCWHLPLTIVNVLWLVGLWTYILANMPLP